MLIKSKFRPPWWLRNPHAQTLVAAKIMRHPSPRMYRERLITPDNDFVDIDWSDEGSIPKPIPNAIPTASLTTSLTTTMTAMPGQAPADDERLRLNPASPTPANKPLVIIFHGLTGSSNSTYVRALAHGLNGLGYRSVAMNFRGCSGEPNLKRESYHSAHTKDISFVIDSIRQRFPDAPLAATGYSLGGNALLKYLAITPDNPLQHAISVSPPLQLAEGAKRMQSGLSRIYQNRLVGQLKNALDEKHQRYPHLGIDQISYKSARTFREFDAAATVPLHGFESVDHYYESASTLQDLPVINTLTHVLFSQDDPFFTKVCIPSSDAMSAQVTFELSARGGHVAFIGSSGILRGHSWLTDHLCALHHHRFQDAIDRAG